MQERQLLERAQRLFLSGDARAALALTDEHARQFPNGALVPERLALRARAHADLAHPRSQEPNPASEQK
jgi:hypothetical protein